MELNIPFRWKNFWPLFITAAICFGCSGEKKNDAPPDLQTNKAASRENQKRILQSRVIENPPPETPVVDSKKVTEDFRKRLQAITGKTYVSDDVLKTNAEKGDVESQLQLAGAARERGDSEEALKWFRAAAEQGSAEAQHMMGVIYVFGQGVQQDYAEAVKWFVKAAEQGDISSQYSLGVRYLKGDHVEKNYAEAVKWFALAAAQGSEQAQTSLGRRYVAGEGVTKDFAEAYKWYAIAAKNGSSAGETLRDKLTASMTPEQIADGKNRADNFVVQPRAHK